MAEGSLLAPNLPPSSTSSNAAILGRRLLIRKTVDYHSTSLRYLENRIWQRDRRDMPLIQPDSTYYNEVCTPNGLNHVPVNVVTTKFVKACTNKTRSPIFSTAWVPDGRRLVTGAASGEFTLWNGINFNFESIIQAHDCSVRSINWSHNGKWMVTTDDRGFIKYWQINFNNVHTYQAHSEPVRSSSFSPTDAKLATCSDDGTVRVFDFLSCTEEHIMRGHGADVKCLDWHPRKSLLASGSKDNQQPVKLWDPKSGQSVCTIHAHKATVMDISWNRNGNWLATAARDFLIKLYDIRAMKELTVLKGHKKDVNTISWHPVHEKVFASGGSDGAILFWMVGNDREIGGMESAHEGFVWTLSWHPLGHLLCSGANDHTCKFWCRNRPGEELKDKYNSFHNPFFMGDEMDASGNLPGMNIDYNMRGGGGSGHMIPPPRDAIKLPPPPSTVSPWGQGGEDSNVSMMSAQNHRVDVPVLGADIIRQTFADKGLPNHYQNGPEFNEKRQDGPTPLLTGGIRPLLADPPHRGGYHGDQDERGGDGWGRPVPYSGGPRPPPEEMGGGNRYNWHRFDYQPRRAPSFDEERWNPFVYRRSNENNAAPAQRLNPGPPQGPGRRPSEEFYRPPPPDEQFSSRRGEYDDRQYGRPPPPSGDRQFSGPPPEDFGRPPHSGDRQYGGPPPPEEFVRPPPSDRQFGGPPPEEYSRPPLSGDRQYGGPPPEDYGHPPPSNDRQFVRAPSSSMDHRFGGGPHERENSFPQDPRQPPPTEDRNFVPSKQFPSDPRQRGPEEHHFPPPGGRGEFYQPPPPRDLFHSDHPPPHQYDSRFKGHEYTTPPNQEGGAQFNNAPPPRERKFPQDPRQPPPPNEERNFPPHSKQFPSDPRQRGQNDQHHFPPPGDRGDPNFGHPSNYLPPRGGGSEYSDHRQYGDHYGKGRGEYSGHDGRGDARFDRGSSTNWRSDGSDRRRDDHDNRRRGSSDQGGGRFKGKEEAEQRGRRRGDEKDSPAPSTKRPKREQVTATDSARTSSSRGHSKKK